MYKGKRKQIFVHNKIRKYLLEKELDITISKYCLLDFIRRFSRNENEACDKSQRTISEWIGIKTSCVSTYLNYFKDKKLIRFTSLGIELGETFPLHFFEKEEHSEKWKKQFVIIDIDIKRDIELDIGFLTFEQMAVLSTLYSLKRNKRKITKTKLSNFSMVSRGTVTNCLEKLTKMGLIENINGFQFTELGEDYLLPLKNPNSVFE